MAGIRVKIIFYDGVNRCRDLGFFEKNIIPVVGDMVKVSDTEYYYCFERVIDYDTTSDVFVILRVGPPHLYKKMRTAQ